MISFFEIQIQYFHVGIKSPFPMTKSTFKGISFLGVLSWVTVHSQTEKYVEIISTTLDWKVKHVRVFQNSIRGIGRNLSSQRWKWEILLKGGTFSVGGENLSRSDFDHLYFFLMLKTPFCIYRTSINPTLVWPIWN